VGSDRPSRRRRLPRPLSGSPAGWVAVHRLTRPDQSSSIVTDDIWNLSCFLFSLVDGGTLARESKRSQIASCFMVVTIACNGGKHDSLDRFKYNAGSITLIRLLPACPVGIAAGLHLWYFDGRLHRWLTVQALLSLHCQRHLSSCCGGLSRWLLSGLGNGN